MASPSSASSACADDDDDGDPAATRHAADLAARLFNHHPLVRGADRRHARRFVLQCVFCLFAEDLGLAPAGLFRARLAAPDRFAEPFRRLAPGLFHAIHPIDPTPDALAPLAAIDWSRVHPTIFGELFETSLDRAERHALGAHFTSEEDILKIVTPTIVRPWVARIDAARTPAELDALRDQLLKFRVLDPACGCGNFLHVAYRELRRLERRILGRHRDLASRPRAGATPQVRLSQMIGLDIDGFAALLARTTLMLARRMQEGEPDIREADALLVDWPEVDAIIGNPPFLDARRFAHAELHRAFPGVPGRADLCVYWFRKAHDHLRPGQRAGLVGTNTIRQNYSRQGGLDHIVTDGVITDAVATQVWSGDAAVHVSIVNWIKGEYTGPCELATQLGDAIDGPWRSQPVPRISSSLSPDTDVAGARKLVVCSRPFCFEGIQPGHRGFRLTADERRALTRQDPRSRAVLSPYMNGDDLLSGAYLTAPEYLIDFGERSLTEAMQHPALFAHLKRTVLPDWRQNARHERERTGRSTGEHQHRMLAWWRLKRPRSALQSALGPLPRYIVCSRVTKRPIFAFLSRTIKPDSSLTVFAAADDYSFGVLQSSVHWAWFQARCSTLKGDPRYTSNTVFDSFVWPQTPKLEHVQAVARAAVALRAAREQLMDRHGWSLRELYRTLEAAGESPLRTAQAALDVAVRAAYGIAEGADTLAFLLHQNHAVAEREARRQPVTGPGLPPCVRAPDALVTADCVAV